MSEYNEDFIRGLYERASAALRAYHALRAAHPKQVIGTQIEASAIEVEVLGNILGDKIDELYAVMEPLIEAERKVAKKKK